MLGPIVNAITIIICGVAGAYVVKGIPEKYGETIKKALGLSVVYIGLKGTFETEHVMLLIISLVIGSIVGEFIDIEKQMNRLGDWTEEKMGLGGGTFSKGFVGASLLFCVGSMAIVGALNSGLQGNHEMLYAKSILDGVFAVVFSSTMGIGVAFAAIPVFLYEGSIALGATFIKDFLTPEIITEMSAVGSLLIAAIGLNFLQPQQIRVGNMIPGVFFPWIYFGVLSLF